MCVLLPDSMFSSRPVIGLIRIHVFEGLAMVVDSGNLFDTTYKGGRVGVYGNSQQGAIYSDLSYV